MSTSDEFEYITLDKDGSYVAVNIHTGEERLLNPVGLVQPLENFSKSTYTLVKTEDGDLVYVPNNIPKELLAELQGKSYHIPYTQLMADKIIELVYEGKTLTQISKMEGYPKYSTIALWRRTYPDFNEAYKMARQDRAEVYFTKALDVVENVEADRDEIARAKLQSDMYKFAAKVSAPDDYAEKSTVDARVAVGTFIIETGIRREGDQGYNPDHAKDMAGAEPEAIAEDILLGEVPEP